MTISLQCKGDPLNLAEAYLTLHEPEGIVQSLFLYLLKHFRYKEIVH